MKNKGSLIKAPSLLLILLLILSLCLTACKDGQAESGDGETEAEESFKPSENKGEESELYLRYVEYKENASLAFKEYSPLDGGAFVYDMADGRVTIVKYVGKEAVIVIPESIGGARVEAIKEGAFSGGGVRAVYVPDSVKRIEKGAFEGCEGISTLRLPFVGDGGDNAFLGYIFGADEPDKNAVAIPQSLDMVILGEGCESVADEAFKNAKSLSAVILPESVGSIGALAFYQCLDLVYIDLGGAFEIGEYSLADCKSLYSVDISGVETVGEGALYSAGSLNNITLSLKEGDYLGKFFGAKSPDHNEEFVPKALRAVNVAEGCEIIPDRAFSLCRYITEVSLPSTLESVGIRAFYACRSLEGVTIPDSVVIIEDDAFFGCDNLASLTLGSSLEKIGMQAFYGCMLLESVDFPASLSEIGASAFYGCVSMSAAALNGQEKIGEDAFGNCPLLKE